MDLKYTPDPILKLGKNEIFVFGSNKAGLHGAGAAALATKKFGAIMGVGEGRTGRCYAIPTKDKYLNPRSLDDITDSVLTFLIYVEEYPA